MPLIYSYLKNILAKIRPYFPFLIYFAVILLVTPKSISWPHRLIFIFYGVFIFWILKYQTPIDNQDNARDLKRLGIFLLVFSFLFLLASRLIMFIRFGATPLGYDTGYYWQYIDLVTSLGKIGNALGSNHLAYIPWFPFFYLKIPNLITIHFFHILHQALTAGALYFLIRSIFPRRLSLIASAIILFLFAISINQFMAFWWMFYKQSMSIPFLMLSLGLFFRRSFWAIPVAAFGTAVHLQPAIAFVIAFALFIFIKIINSIVKKQPLEKEIWYLMGGGLLAIIALAILKGPADIKAHLDYFLHFRGLATGGERWEIEQAKGLFISGGTFRVNAFFYLPFALIGIIKSRTWLLQKGHPRFLLVILVAAATLLLSSYPFLYQHRSLILLDLFLIIFAVYPLLTFIQRFLNDYAGRFILGLLFAGSVLFTSQIIWNNPPQLYDQEARELKMLRLDAPVKIRKSDDYAMATSALYTPWVYAFTGFEQTIAPGWLQWDRWNLSMWKEFWTGNNNARRLELLQIYDGHNIFMFFGEHQQIYPDLKKLLDTDLHFTKISPHIWKYSPNPL